MTTFLILALCVVVLWAGSKVLIAFTKSDRRTIESRAPVENKMNRDTRSLCCQLQQAIFNRLG